LVSSQIFVQVLNVEAPKRDLHCIKEKGISFDY